MATYNELAAAYAAQKQSDYENSLSYLTSDLSSRQSLDESALKSRYDTLLSQLDRQGEQVVDTYDDSAQQAYVNKMLTGKELSGQLSQMGLNTQGFGVNQQMMNENAYGAALSTAKKTRDTGVREIGNAKIDTSSEYNQDLLGLQSDYNAKLSEIRQYIDAQGTNMYNQQYSNYISDLQYQDAMRQQSYENYLNGGGGNGGFNDTPTNTTPTTGTPTGTTKPKTYGDRTLTDTKARIEVDGVPVAVEKASIAGGTDVYVYWNGSQHVPLTQVQKAALGLVGNASGGASKSTNSSPVKPTNSSSAVAPKTSTTYKSVTSPTLKTNAK